MKLVLLSRNVDVIYLLGPNYMGKTTRKADLLSRIRQMDPSGFQQFTAELWERRGHKVEVVNGHRVSLKTKSGGGLFRRKTTTAVQPLFRKKGESVDKSDMNRILEIRWEDDIDEITVVTTTDFTKKARKKGKRDEVTLIDGDDLAELVVEENAEDLVPEPAKGSAIGGLFWLLVIFPIKAIWYCLVVSAKLTWLFLTLPFKLISGSSTEKGDT